MPRLLVFAACEKVIIDQHNNVSLITLLQQLTSEVPEQTSESGKAVISMKWDAFALWFKNEGEDNTEFEQRVVLVDPSGNETGVDGTSTFRFGDKQSMRATLTVLGFPVYAPGRYTVKMWLHEKGQTDSGEPAAEYPIDVVLQQPKD